MDILGYQEIESGIGLDSQARATLPMAPKRWGSRLWKENHIFEVNGKMRMENFLENAFFALASNFSLPLPWW